MGFDRADMALRGRIGGLRRAARYDPDSLTRAARSAFRDSFLRKADPDASLDAQERERRAELLRRAHYAELARKSAIARKKKAARLKKPGGAIEGNGVGQPVLAE